MTLLLCCMVYLLGFLSGAGALVVVGVWRRQHYLRNHDDPHRKQELRALAVEVANRLIEREQT